MDSGCTRRTFLKASAVTGAAWVGSRRASAAPGLDLVEAGRSSHQIVLPAGASASQRHAAAELQAFCEKLTGAKLPIITEPTPAPARGIFLGQTAVTQATLGDLPTALGDDGFRLVTRGPHLFIVGSAVRGTLYGVYELLEKYGGCRWYASFHSVIPSRATWSLPELDETQTPAFAMREPFWWDMFDGDQAARNKANGNSMRLEERHGGKIRFGGGLFVHTFNPLLPPEQHFAAHPEYYSEINGVRTADHSQLCLTNPKVLELVTGAVLERIRKDPGGKLFSVSQNDWRNNCTCAACRTIDEREGSPSGTLIHFVNQVAEAVEKEFPQVWIETLAYQYTRHPPKTLRVRPNVVPRLCTIECDFSKPLPVSTAEQNVRFVEDIKGWAAQTDKLYIWDYVTNFGNYIGPHPNFAALQGNVQFFREHRVVGLFEQGAYQGAHGEFAELRGWLLAKLLWNPDVNIAALYDDFFTGYYGAAAEPVRAYFDELQALVTGPEIRLGINAPVTSPWYTDAFFDRATQLFAEAERRVKDDEQALYRVQMSGLPVLYARLQRHPPVPATTTLEGDLLKPVDVPAEYRDLAAEALRRCRAGKVRVAESAERHQAFLDQLRDRTEGYPLKVARLGDLEVGLAPERGGQVLTLRRAGTSYLAWAAGGLDAIDTRTGVDRGDGGPHTVVTTQPTALVLRRDPRVGPRSERRLTLTPAGLQLTAAWIGREQRPATVSPVLRAALDLGDAGALVVRAGDGPWQPLTVGADRLRETFELRDLGQPLTLASAVTGRAVRLRWSAAPTRAVLQCDTTTNAARVVAIAAARELARGAELTVGLALEPLGTLTGLPPVDAPARREARVVSIDELAVNLARYGEWGELAADPAASNGWAMKLFNTHYEWCLMWPVRPELFTPGAQYRARARLRVEKGDREGKAFWAGVYDTARKKGWGQVDPLTSAVKDGYQWYDLATWLPEAQQYVWVGPGVFDLKGGQKSAIQAVWVDQLEFQRVE